MKSTFNPRNHLLFRAVIDCEEKTQIFYILLFHSLLDSRECLYPGVKEQERIGE
jgi:hypothetical protein